MKTSIASEFRNLIIVSSNSITDLSIRYKRHRNLYRLSVMYVMNKGSKNIMYVKTDSSDNVLAKNMKVVVRYTITKAVILKDFV